MRMNQNPFVPSFFLYGEAPRDVGDRFLHLENLDDRSRPSDWNIRPHAHGNLNHIFFILNGAGEMQSEQGTLRFASPALLLIPAGVIHAFIWQPETTGHVLTIADTYAEVLCLREPAFLGLFKTSLKLSVRSGTQEANGLSKSLVLLARELSWRAPGHAAAVEAHLLAFLVEVLRIALRDQETAKSKPGRHAEIVAEFRQLVEAEFRNAQPLETYAKQLKLTMTQLRSACLKITRKPPNRLVRDRLILEAKRMLLYSNMTIAETAYNLGFEDPAYFSRFFKKATRSSPRLFRQQH